MNNLNKPLNQGLYLIGNRVAVRLKEYDDKEFGEAFVFGGQNGITMHYVQNAKTEGLKVISSEGSSGYLIRDGQKDFSKLLKILKDMGVTTD